MVRLLLLSGLVKSLKLRAWFLVLPLPNEVQELNLCGIRDDGQLLVELLDAERVHYRLQDLADRAASVVVRVRSQLAVVLPVIVTHAEAEDLLLLSLDFVELINVGLLAVRLVIVELVASVADALRVVGVLNA